MKELYELKEKLCDELKEYSRRDVSNGSLDVVDKLAHAIKNLDKIIDSYDGHSNYYPMRSYAKRDSMGRYSKGYSYHGDMISELHELMNDAPDERTKQEFKRFIQKIESM